MLIKNNNSLCIMNYKEILRLKVEDMAIKMNSFHLKASNKIIKIKIILIKKILNHYQNDKVKKFHQKVI